MVCQTISVIIITKNEESNIRGCLESVAWADEIVVVDSGSVDRTLEICAEYTDRCYSMDWPGFGVQKQRALSLATCEWVLSVDADERVTEELKNEITSVLKQRRNTVCGYCIPRLSSYFGKQVRYSGWYPDYVLRLALRKKAEFTDDKVHEKMVVVSSVGKMNSNLEHFPHESIEHHFRKINDYSTLSALKMYDQGKKVSWITVYAHALFAFFRVLVLRRGFMDGWVGLALSVSSGVHVYLKYIKLLEMRNIDR